jgi:hypothetical protein
MTPRRTASIGTSILAVSLICSLPVLAGSRIERQLALAPGGEFVLDADLGSVTVRGGSSDGARVVVTSKRDDLETHAAISFDESAGRAVVRVEKKGGVTRWFKRDPGLKFEIEVPGDTALNIDTSGGSVVLDIPLTVQGKISRTTVCGTLGEGGSTLTPRSSGGSIRVGSR